MSIRGVLGMPPGIQVLPRRHICKALPGVNGLSAKDKRKPALVKLWQFQNLDVVQGVPSIPEPVQSGGAPTDATYITQTAHAGLSNEQALSTLQTGIVRVANGSGVLSSLKDNLTADRPPHYNDDSAANYSVGSRWIYVSPPVAEEYVCVDATAGAARWQRLTGHYRSRRSWAIQAATGTSYTNYGIPLPTPAGTVTDPNDAADKMINHQTPTTAGTAVGLISATFDLFQAQWYPTIIFKIRVGSAITNVRHWIGYFPSAPTNSDSPPNNSLAFRFSSVAGDTQWRGVIRGTSDFVTPGIGPTVVANGLYILKIRVMNVTAAYFSVNGSPEEWNAVSFAGNVNLGWAARVINTTTAQRDLRIAWVYGEMGAGLVA